MFYFQPTQRSSYPCHMSMKECSGYWSFVWKSPIQEKVSGHRRTTTTYFQWTFQHRWTSQILPPIYLILLIDAMCVARRARQSSTFVVVVSRCTIVAQRASESTGEITKGSVAGQLCTWSRKEPRQNKSYHDPVIILLFLVRIICADLEKYKSIKPMVL